MKLVELLLTLTTTSLANVEENLAMLQVRGKNSAVLEAKGQVQTIALAGRFAEELNYVEDLALTAARTNSTIDEAAEQALVAIRNTLENTLLLLNNSDHNDQGLVDAQLQQVEACGTTFQEKKKENTISKANADTMEAAHSTCRSTLGGIIGDKTTKCNQLEGFVNGLSPPNNICDVPKDPAGTLTDYWTHYKTFYDNNFATWQLLQQQCDNQVGLAESTEVECDNKQAAFESAMCQLRIEVLSACEAYSSCYDSTAADYASVTSTALNQADTRKVEYKSIEKIKCYIRILLEEDAVTMDSFNACKDFDPDVSHLDIHTPPVPSKDECDKSSIAVLPCNDVFTAKYAGMAGIDACTKCTALPTYLSDDGTAANDLSSDACQESEWPDLDHGLTCGPCKVLVNRYSSHYKTCTGYCESMDRQCVDGWEESGDTCTVSHHIGCDHLMGSSDAICECSPDVKLPPPIATSEVCKESQWPDRDHGLTCGPCKVLVNRYSSHYKTCTGYCDSMGRQCVDGWEESGDTCTVSHHIGCDHIMGSSDAICECSPEVNAPAEFMSVDDNFNCYDEPDCVILATLREQHCEQKDGWSLMTDSECRSFMEDNNYAEHNPWSNEWPNDGLNCIFNGNMLAFNKHPNPDHTTSSWFTLCVRRGKQR